MRIVAHRGASAYAPENTLAAFRLALEMGAAELELDVRQTRDGRLAVIHDPDLRRVAGAKRRVADMSVEDLGRYDVGRWFSPAFSGERIPLLEGVLDLALGRALLHVEVKEGGKAYPGMEERLLALLRKRRALGQVVVSSFDPPTLFRLRKLERDLPLAYLYGSSSPQSAARAVEEAVRMGARSLDLSRRLARPALVREARRKKLEVIVYTVNDLAEARRLEAMGVDGVFSNHPDLAVPAPVGGTEG